MKMRPSRIPDLCAFGTSPVYSTSSPIVAGVAALVLGEDWSLTPFELGQRILSTRRIPMLNPGEWGSGYSMGMVDAYSAVTGEMP